MISVWHTYSIVYREQLFYKEKKSVMKKFVKPAAFAVAIILLSFTQPAKAAVGPHLWYSSLGKHTTSSGSRFSIELNRKDAEEVISAVIENPDKKNLCIRLTAPDGSTLDNFYTGRKYVKMNKRYNFSGAEEGVYTITISDGVEKIQKQVKLERAFSLPVSRLIVQ